MGSMTKDTVALIEVTKVETRMKCWVRAKRIAEIIPPEGEDYPTTILVMRDPEEQIEILEDGKLVLEAMGGELLRVGDPDEA